MKPKVTMRIVDTVAVISLTGDLESESAPAVQEHLSQLIMYQSKALIDLKRVRCMSNAGLRTLLLVYRKARALNHSVALVGLTPELSNVMAATGFLDFFIVSKSVPAGIVLLNGESKGEVLEYAKPGT